MAMGENGVVMMMSAFAKFAGVDPEAMRRTIEEAMATAAVMHDQLPMALAALEAERQRSIRLEWKLDAVMRASGLNPADIDRMAENNIRPILELGVLTPEQVGE